MPNAFAIAAARIAQDPNIGADAIYTPEGEAPMAIRVTWGREEAPMLGIGRGIVSGGTYCHIQTADVPDRPKVEELISIGALDFTIATSELDPSSATWRCLLRAG